MSEFGATSHHERLVSHIQDLERLDELKSLAADNMKEAFQRAKVDGFDPQTLRVVLRLRKLTPGQRRERRALEAIYLAELGMLDGDALPDEARRRLDPPSEPDRSTEPPAEPHQPRDPALTPPAPKPAQPPLVLKEPAEARQEGEAAAEAGKRIYDNPYPAGDPCRAAWDEGWCAKRQSNGMDLPEAYQRRTTKPPEKDGDQKGTGAGSGGAIEKGAA